MTRLVKKPRLSLTTIGVLPSWRTTSKARASAASDVWVPRMISTSGILSTGEKKWRPTKSSGRETPVASSLIGSDEGFEVSSDPGRLPRGNALGARAAVVDVVQVEPERLDHVLRRLPGHQIDEVAGLDGERVVDVDLQALDRRAEDVVGGRVGRTLQLLAQVRGEGGEVGGERRRRRS